MDATSHRLPWHSAGVGAIVMVVLWVGSATSLGSREDTHKPDDGSPSPAHEAVEPNYVVAVVDGVPIPYGAIQVNLTPAEPCELDLGAHAVAKEIRERELERLAARIQKIILDRQFAELGITASCGEIEARIERTFKESGFTSDDVSRMREQLQALHSALTEWHKNPPAADTIYRERLQKIGIPMEQWRLFRFSYDTPDKLIKFKVPKDVEEMKANSWRSARADVLSEKLDKIITAKVSVSDEEVRAAYQKQYRDVANAPTLSEVKDRIRVRLLDARRKQARSLWWRKQYKSATIEVKHPAFTAVLDKLFGSYEAASPPH